MSNKQRKSRRKAFRLWFSKRSSRADASHLSEISDNDDQDDECMDGLFVRSMERAPCNLNNELRIFVGTWNVAGRSPVGSLAEDLDEWLNLKEAADIYVLGFQEIVPLKTKTVIGAEDPTEATNWNVLIGKTLNSKYGGAWLTPMVNPITSYKYDGAAESDSRLSDYEIATSPRGQSRTEYEPSDHVGSYKLMASKKMVGVFISVWLRRALLKKYCVSEVKVSSVACGIMGYLGNKGSVCASMSIGGTSFCFVAAHLASGEKKGDEGKRNHQVSEIFRRTSFPRVLPEDRHKNHPLTILGHDQIFWFGDLNYRLYLEDNLARELIKKEDWSALQEFDQLGKELEDGGVFQGWKEGNIEFAPTYKYSSSNCNRYSGGLPSKAGEKQRTPAWCDRILWYGKGVKQLSYFRSESKFSDHRPVSALFSVLVEDQKRAHSSLVPSPPFSPLHNS
ncbi:Type I inositol 1,4,5-trisphosphate 5-phosphatase 1 [Capsicum annuum]|uniref:type IV inositol polyphosphate 5-phosphatase 6 n=1 Tax=Capsicum annuum TaxID=4072 RepID=UPI0007BF069C|nr:type IV inositol polyphosphate 5-phosphatase 6 [Capsicum annuum]KAF3625283.1 Type I inositol 1,4,5-trisphosphate 5-phosphatase 1 [Capsicum annuum]